MAKLYAAEVVQDVCTEAVQVLGGYGYGVEFPVERYYRDAKLASITEGTSEIQKLVISREVIKAARNLRGIIKWGVGYENIDVAAATEQGLPRIGLPSAVKSRISP